ncbi:MAG: AzlD domain-containing protein [Comamonas sp.]|nr:AzlD domain-containing protein [Candidatus Comamonas equi]
MSVWSWILWACAAAFVTKWLGYAIPARFLQNPRVTHVAACMTVALLSALTVMNTVAAGQSWAIDARLAALVVAAVALWLRAPFLLVVVLGAAAAAVARWI